MPGQSKLKSNTCLSKKKEGKVEEGRSGLIVQRLLKVEGRRQTS